MFATKRTPASEQLVKWAKEHEGDSTDITTNSGIPVPNVDASLAINPRGQTLLQDYVQLDILSHFDRERIPERVVHAKGAGAFGYFEVTDDISKYTAAKVFSEVGKKTPIAVRFSQVAGEMGSNDTVRDVRGFAVKFYTDDGIWDIVGNNTPIFFIRDSILFPSFIHIMKRNPVTHLRDNDMLFDFLTAREETIHQTLIFFSDRGIPGSYRQMHGYGSNTFGLVNSEGKFHYCKFHYLSNQGISTFTNDEGTKLAGEDPDYLLRDLYNAIANNDYPSWTFYIQVMTPEEAEKYRFDPFDVTKVWYKKDFPLIRVGKFVLNKNQTNYFTDIEQLAFDPAHLVPGIEPSPDRMLQGRLFSYGDTARYRLGVNHLQLPVNSGNAVHNFSRDGFSAEKSQGGAPNYHPNMFNGPKNSERAKLLTPTLPVRGTIKREDTGGEDNYTQAKVLYNKVLDDVGRQHLVDNILGLLVAANGELQERTVQYFGKVDESLRKALREGLQQRQKNHVNL